MADEYRPFVYVALSGDESLPGSCVQVRNGAASSGDISLSFRDENGRPHDLSVNGVFTSVAQPEQVFRAAVQPLCQRVVQGTRTCSVTTLGGAGPQLVEDEGLGALAIRHLLHALEAEGKPGGLRLGLSCFLSDASRPTDLLKNVQQKVPPAMHWANEEGLAGQKFVYCASLSSAQRTVRAVLSAPSLAQLLPRLSYALTLAVRTASSDVPSRISLVELRAEHANIFPATLRDVLQGVHHHDMLSRALHGCRSNDCVVIGQINSDAPRMQPHDGGVAWRSAQQVAEAAAAVRGMHILAPPATARAYALRSPQQHGTPSPGRGGVGSPVPMSAAAIAAASADAAQKVHVDVHVLVPDDGVSTMSTKGGVETHRPSQSAYSPQADMARGTLRTELLHAEERLRDAQARARDAEGAALNANQRAREAESRAASLAADLARERGQAQAHDPAALEGLHADLRDARDDLARMQDEAQESRRALADQKRETERVQRQLSEAHQQRDSAREQCESARNKSSEYHTDLIAARGQAADVANDLQRARQEHRDALDQLQMELAEAHKHTSEATDLRSAQQRLSDALQAEVEGLEEKMHDWEGNTRTLEQALLEAREAVARTRLQGEADQVAAMLAHTEAKTRLGLAHNTRVQAILAELNTAREEADHLAARLHAAEAEVRSNELGNIAASASAKAELADILTQLRAVSAERDRRTETADRLTQECHDLSERIRSLQDGNTEAEAAVRIFEKRAAEAESALDLERLKSATSVANAQKLEAERAAQHTANLELQSEAERRNAELVQTRTTLQGRIKQLEVDVRSTADSAASAAREDVDMLRQQLEATSAENERLVTLRAQDADEVQELLQRLRTLEQAHSAGPHHDSALCDTADNSVYEVQLHRLRSDVAERDGAILALKDKLQHAAKAKAEAERRERLATRRLGDPALSPSPSTASATLMARDDSAEVERLRAELHALRLQQQHAPATGEADSVALRDCRAEAAALGATLRNKEMEVLMLRKEAEASVHEMSALSERCEQQIVDAQVSLEESWKGREQGWVARHQALEVQVSAGAESVKNMEAEKKALEHRAVRAEERLAMAEERMAHSGSLKDDDMRQKTEQLAAVQQEATDLREMVRKLEHEAEQMRHFAETRSQAASHEARQADAAAKQINEVREEAKRREDLLLGQIRSLVSHTYDATKSVDFRDQKTVSPPLRHQKSPAAKGTRTMSPWRVLSPEGARLKAAGPASPSSSDDDDTEEAMILKAQLAAIEAQNETLRQLKAKERDRRRPDEGRLTDLQRQTATDAINETAKARAAARLGGQQRNVSPPRDYLRHQLDSIATRVKSGNYDRRQVDEQLQQLLASVGRPNPGPLP